MKTKLSTFLYIVVTMFLTSCGVYTCPTYTKGEKKNPKTEIEERWQLSEERM